MPRDTPRPQSLARALGEFVGHIRAGIASKPEPSARTTREVSRTVDEEVRDTPRGAVTLRRTVIEEIDLPRE